MKAIFVVGTAGSGKSLLASKMREHYTSSGAFVASINLDPGVEDLPYTCDVDVRDHVDIVSIMKRHGLGPNGALVMANDLVASKIDEVWAEANAVNPDYAIVDTPGQIELFAYRASGPFIARGIDADERACAFLFDGMLVNSPENFVSIALLAESVRLRLAMPAVHALTKADMAPSSAEEVVAWSEDTAALAGALARDSGGESLELSSGILRGLDSAGLAPGITPVSSVTGDGLVTLWASLARAIDRGEEVID